MAIVIHSRDFDLSKLSISGINSNINVEVDNTGAQAYARAMASRRHLSVRYQKKRFMLATPMCQFPSGLIQERGNTWMLIRITNAHFSRTLQGMDRLLFEHVLQHWASMFEEPAGSEVEDGADVVGDQELVAPPQLRDLRAAALAARFRPSVKYRGGRVPLLYVRVSASTKFLRADGTVMAASDLPIRPSDNLDAASGTGLAGRRGVCTIELAMTRITSTRVQLNLHADTVQVL